MGGREISLVIRQPFCSVSGEEMNHLDLFSGPGEQGLYLQMFFCEGTAGMGFEEVLESGGGYCFLRLRCFLLNRLSSPLFRVIKASILACVHP